MYVYHLNPDIDDDSLIIPLIKQINTNPSILFNRLGGSVPVLYRCIDR